RPRCHSAYSSHVWFSRNAFCASARGCTCPQSLSSTYCRASISFRALVTAGLFTTYLAIGDGYPLCHCDPLALHDFGRRAFPGAHGPVHPSAHDGRAFGTRPVDAAARFTQRRPELGEHARRCVADHAPARVPFGGPVLFDEVHRRMCFGAKAFG